MDNIVCPRLTGFLKFTQKLMTRAKKKDYNEKDFCPICGCKSQKGNLCRACFLRSFTPIAYSRNIKVVEQNEYFYGTGKDNRWDGKKEEDRFGAEEEIEKNILNMVVARGKNVDDEDEFGGSCSSAFQGKTITELFTPAQDDSRSRLPSIIPSSELVNIDLCHELENNDAPVDPMPKYLPDFWETTNDEGTPKLAEKLKYLKNHIMKEALRPFKQIIPDQEKMLNASVQSDISLDDGPVSTANLYDQLQEMQSRLQSQPSNNCKSDYEDCRSCSGDSRDFVTYNKNLKQQATLELLKVAFKTNMILNSLYYYFKKVVDSEGSNVDAESRQENDEPLNDGKISVDSFLCPNWRSAVPWGNGAGNEDNVKDNPLEAANTDINQAEERISETEVISQSQATLSMLINRNFSWVSFGNEAIRTTNMSSSDSIDDNRALGNIDRGSNPEEDDFEITKERLTMSEGDVPAPKITRKFHSEHSKLFIKEDSEFEVKNSWSTSSKTTADTAEEIMDSGEASVVKMTEGSDGTGLKGDDSGKSLLDMVFGLNRVYDKPSLLPLPESRDLISLNSPQQSNVSAQQQDAISQTALSSKHLEQEMNLLHKAFLDQLAHFSIQLVESCKAFGYSWQTSFLAELVEHFRAACNIISTIIANPQSLSVSSDRLDELQDVSNKISICLAKLRAHPHSFMGDCADHDISTLLSSPPGFEDVAVINTWV